MFSLLWVAQVKIINCNAFVGCQFVLLIIHVPSNVKKFLAAAECFFVAALQTVNIRELLVDVHLVDWLLVRFAHIFQSLEDTS